MAHTTLTTAEVGKVWDGADEEVELVFPVSDSGRLRLRGSGKSIPAVMVTGVVPKTAMEE
jgi:hypothetical protein